MRIACSFFIAALFTVSTAQAQMVSGIVTDSHDNEPVQSVLVTNKRTKTDIRTNAAGQFKIQAIWGDTLLISHPAFSFSSFIVRSTQLTIPLVNRMHKLDEVEVISGMTKYQRDSATRQAIYHKTLADAKQKTKISLNNGIALEGILTSLASGISGKKKRDKKFAKMLAEDNKMRYTQVRYSRELVSKLTSLSTDSAMIFIEQNPMPYDFARSASDLEIKIWIREHYRQWILPKPTMPDSTGTDR